MVCTHMHFLNVHIYVLLLCRKESSSIDISVENNLASLSIKLYRLREDLFTEVTCLELDGKFV